MLPNLRGRHAYMLTADDIADTYRAPHVTAKQML